jgi:hypothetical protein
MFVGTLTILIMEPINIDKELIEFKEHIERNERTILSSGFGDGKTYFLDKFKENNKGQFKFITIYPVNYQIANNREVFEYIKRDILIQMVANGMIKPDYEIPESMMIQYFIMNNSGTIFDTLLGTMPLLGLTEPTVAAFLLGLKSLKCIKSMYDWLKDYKKKIENKEDINIIESFIESFSMEKGGPYEIDLITKLIIDNIRWYKESSPKRKVILIIEDLDRIDPEHMFRILNVFTAHIDRKYQLESWSLHNNDNMISYENLDNKFGFDNIVTVFDYDRTEQTFRHKYGEKANYKGYISKFIIQVPYKYSITETARKRLREYIVGKCFVSELTIGNGNIYNIGTKIRQLSVRDVQQILDNIDSYIYDDIAVFGTKRIRTITPITRFIVILHLLGFSNDEINHIIFYRLSPLERLNCINSFIYSTIRNNNNIVYENETYAIEEKTIGNDIESIVFKKIIGYSDCKVDRATIENSLRTAFKYVKGF